MPTLQKVTRLQRKGQVTIPIEIREKLGLEEGDLVAFEETEQGIMIKPQAVIAREELAHLEGVLQNLRDLNQGLSEAASVQSLTSKGLDERGEVTQRKVFKEMYS